MAQAEASIMEASYSKLYDNQPLPKSKQGEQNATCPYSPYRGPLSLQRPLKGKQRKGRYKFGIKGIHHLGQFLLIKGNLQFILEVNRRNNNSVFFNVSDPQKREKMCTLQRWI